MALIIDFDTDDWMPALEEALGDLVKPATKDQLRTNQFQYPDDALKALADAEDIDAIIDKTLNWIKANEVRAYHGTRLTDGEVVNVLKTGLRPLIINERVDWLRKTIPELQPVLTDAFVARSIAVGMLDGRESQVHAAISRKEMFGGYDYLFAGSEFDRRLLEYGDRDDLVGLVTARGKPRLIRIVLPGGDALDAMHPIFPIEFTRSNDVYPNLVRELLTDLTWSLHSPADPRTGVDSCLHFKKAIPGHFIEAVDMVEDRAT